MFTVAKTGFVTLIQPVRRFLARDIPPREWLFENAIPHPSLGMLYAWRGCGKTFTALDMAVALAAGRAWADYPCPKPRRVLYVDGEMPLGDLATRLRDLCGKIVPAGLYILASEDMMAAGNELNLAKSAHRNTLLRALAKMEERDESIDFMVLDNWSALVRGVDENDNAALDPIKSWLVMLRHARTSVLLIHHAGKGGAQRGASAREDNLDYSIQLNAVLGHSYETRLRWTWDKCRGLKPDPPSFDLAIREDADGAVKLWAPVQIIKKPRRGERHGD